MCNIAIIKNINFIPQEDINDSMNDTDSAMNINLFSDTVVSILDGAYQYSDNLLNCIGVGSYGHVYRGLDLAKGKEVAIKKLIKSDVKPNEIKVMKSINSRYLVKFIDVHISDINLYIIMELCSIDLEKHLQLYCERQILDDFNLRILTDNICQGYLALYNNQIVHRDIKPQNILITYDNNKNFESAKITDFGISRLLNEEKNGMCCNIAGTPEYMAPEIAANILKDSDYNHQVDMWSIGCLLYRCIAGHVPFDEAYLCKLILYSACSNYDAYDKPEMPEEMPDQEFINIVNSLLEFDPIMRTKPEEFHELALAWAKQ